MDLLLVKVTALLAAALSGAWLLRRASAPVRHALWTATFVSVLALPLLSWMMPTIAVPVATAREERAPVDVAPAVPVEVEWNARPFVSPPVGAESPAVVTPITSAPRQAPVAPAVDPETVRPWPRPTLGGVVFGVWLTGLIVALAAIVVSLVGVHRVMVAGEEMMDPDWRVALVEVSRLFGRRPARLLVSPAVTVPMAGGVWRPTIFLPLDAQRWPIDWRAVVLAHETAHLAGYDPLRHLIARFALAVYWFHPLAWWAVRQARADCEQACDQAVVSGGVLPSTYARLLLALAAARRGRQALAALPMASRSGLERRLIAILNDEAGRPRRGLALAMAVTVLLTAAAIGPLVPASVAPPHLAAILIAERILAAPSLSAPQTNAAQPLNMVIPMVNGTGAISGVVTDATTKRPIHGVVVYLGPSDRGPVGQPTTQVSDAQGRFVFSDLPSSEAYFINASKSGYFDGHSGRTTSTQVGARIAVAEGQWVNDVNIVMSRSAALSGTVTDEHGDPVVGAYVRVLAEVLISGQPQLVAGSVTTTDDRGGYRISGLPPGRYLIHVPVVQESVPAAMPATQLAGLTPQVATARQAAGRPMPVADTMAIDPNVRVAVGRYVAGPAPMGGRSLAYAPMFYPNARSIASAVPVDLASGDDRSGLDIRLEPLPVWRISGVVQGPAEAVLNLPMRLLARGAEDLGDGGETATTFTGADGTFTFLNVPAGSYTIDASGSVAQLTLSDLAAPTKALPRPVGTPIGGTFSPLVAAAPRGTRFSTRVVAGAGNAYTGRARLEVNDRDVKDVVVPLQRGVTITGRVVWDGPRPTGTTFLGGLLSNSSSLIVMAEPARGRPSLGYPRSQTDASGSFSIDGLLAGEYVLRFPGGGSVKSVMWEGRDHTNAPFDASSGRDFTDVIVTLTTQTILLAGTVRDGQGAVSKTAEVIVFPEEHEQWSAYGLSPTRIKAASVNSAGLYRFSGLPAGKYFVVAVDDSKVDAWQDPKFLEAAGRMATRLTLEWGAKATQDLVLTQVP